MEKDMSKYLTKEAMSLPVFVNRWKDLTQLDKNGYYASTRAHALKMASSVKARYAALFDIEIMMYPNIYRAAATERAAVYESYGLLSPRPYSIEAQKAAILHELDPFIRYIGFINLMAYDDFLDLPNRMADEVLKLRYGSNALSVSQCQPQPEKSE